MEVMKELRSFRKLLTAITLSFAVVASFPVLNVKAVPAGDDIQGYFDRHSSINAADYGLSPCSDQTAGCGKTEVVIKGTRYDISNEGIAKVQGLLTAEAAAANQIDQVNNQLSQIDDNLQVKPDIEGAAGLMGGFMGGINYFLGIVITIITIGMTVFTALDLSYIAFPVFRGKCEEAKESGKGVSHSRSQKAGSTRLVFISDEAEYAVNSAETATSGKSPIITYIVKRSIAIIAIAIADFILLTGNLSVLTDLALDVASGIIKAIQTIGH